MGNPISIALLMMLQGAAPAPPLFPQCLPERTIVQAIPAGSQTLDAAMRMERLAACLERSLRYADAEPLRRRVLDIRNQLLGEGSTDAGAALNGLVVNLEAQGRFRDAEPYLRKLVAIVLLLEGRTWASGKAYERLRDNLARQGRRDESMEVDRIAMRIYFEHRVTTDPENYSLVGNAQQSVARANAFRSGMQWNEAERLYREAIQIMSGPSTANHPFGAAARWQLADMLFFRSILEPGTDRIDEVVSLSLDAIRIAAITQNPTAPEILGMQHMLASRIGRHRPQVALDLYRRATEALHAAQRSPGVTNGAGGALAVSHLDFFRKQAGAAWRLAHGQTPAASAGGKPQPDVD